MTDQVTEVFRADDPIPAGVRVGPLIHLLRVNGTPAEGIEAQLDTAFERLRATVEQAGASVDNVAQVSFFLKHRQDIGLVNGPWLELFPNETDRPTYKFMVAEGLAGDELVHIEAFALAGARRRVLHIPGVAHTNPIPMGVRIGDMLFSSRVLPYDPSTGKPAEGVENQAKHLFGNVRQLLEVGGLAGRDITQGRLFVADPAYLSVAQPHWQSLVSPGAKLHVTHYTLAPALLVMLEVIAVGS